VVKGKLLKKERLTGGANYGGVSWTSHGQSKEAIQSRVHPLIGKKTLLKGKNLLQKKKKEVDKGSLETPISQKNRHRAGGGTIGRLSLIALFRCNAEGE